ncbi:MAG: hypothetical protein IAG13_19900, partial [Deltaproteobacteria bacterium]|nr:hypothetical protein [Nannocystaceae bacterium]
MLACALACFDPSDELRGMPCTGDASCGDLGCSYGFCGGPPRCAEGAGVGDYCFALTDETFATAGAARVMTVGRVDLDPYPDVVSVADDGRASVLLNDGSGGLASAIDA